MPVKKGMKWGYNDGKKNGKRTASDVIMDVLGVDERQRMNETYQKSKVSKERMVIAEQELKDSNILNRKEKESAYKQAQKDELDARIESVRSEMDYSMTPLGMIDTLQEEVNKGKNWIKNKLGIH